MQIPSLFKKNLVLGQEKQFSWKMFGVLALFLLVLLEYSLFFMPEIADASKGESTEIEEILSLNEGKNLQYVVEVQDEDSLNPKNLDVCLKVVEKNMVEFSQWIQSLERVVIHNNMNYRRGMANDTVIYIRCLPDMEEFLNVLIHEIGHVVDLGYLVAEDENTELNSSFLNFEDVIPLEDPSLEFYKISWKNDSEHSRRAEGMDFVSEYSQSNSFEDFAESFLMYVRYPEIFLEYAKVNPSLLKKYSFIKNSVFAGKEFLSVDDVIPLSVYEKARGVRPYDATLLHKEQLGLLVY